MVLTYESRWTHHCCLAACIQVIDCVCKKDPLATTIILKAYDNLVEVSGKPVDLTPSEFKILLVLISNPGRTYSRGELLGSLGETTYLEGYERTVDVHIHNLREKIEPDHSNPIYIQTVYGTGYRFARERT